MTLLKVSKVAQLPNLMYMTELLREMCWRSNVA